MALTKLTTSSITGDTLAAGDIAADAITASELADNAVDTAAVADDAITLAKMASGTDGNIISYDASGNPVAIATGNDGQVLTSTGAGSPPAFENASGTTINNNADNRVITGSGTANTLEGEANLTYSSPDLTVTGGNPSIIHNNTTSGGTSGIKFQGSGTDYGFSRLNNSAGNLEIGTVPTWSTRFYTNNTNRMTIDGSGNILIGKTSNDWGADGIQFEKVSGTNEYFLISTRDDGDTHFQTRKNNATGSAMKFYYNSSLVGNITQSTSSTSYGTSSDYRLKENEVVISDGIERLKQLKPYRFNFKTDADKTVDGFFAHEVSSVVPEAIQGEKDGAEMQGIDQSKLVPLLTSALQEAVTKIEALEARVTTLENA